MWDELSWTPTDTADKNGKTGITSVITGQLAVFELSKVDTLVDAKQCGNTSPYHEKTTEAADLSF